MKTNKKAYPKWGCLILKKINNKRAKIVIEHILNHGHITTEELEHTYGYNHPPRAARDVREAGIPLETFKVKSSKGKSIAAYRFGDLSKIQANKLGGRNIFTKDFKHRLYNKMAGKCFICNGKFEERDLQIDHRVPYEISGDNKEIKQSLNDYMLLCSSCNRAKSWSCEHCENWKVSKEPSLCKRCYWGNPEDYTHIALKQIRRLDVQWQGSEVRYFEDLKKESIKYNIKLPEFVKELIENYLNKNANKKQRRK